MRFTKLDLDQEGVYLLHFHGSIADHAGHYLGYAENIAARIERHKAGNGARLMRAVMEQGLSFTVARIWPGMDRAGERKLKKRKKHRQLCPVCKKESSSYQIKT